MRHGSLSAELDAITKEFDYGIVPGSATIFVKDEANGLGRLDLTLLEGVMIVLEVTDQGYKVTSCSPLCNVNPALATSQTIETYLEQPFESMENLLMTISPMFRDRFQQELFNKLQSVQQHQNSNPTPKTVMFTPENNTVNSNTNDIQSFDEINDWIN